MNEELYQAVVNQLGDEETLGDVRSGQDGWHGFVYDNECKEFVETNRKLIMDELIELADGCGVSVSELVAGFKCLKEWGISRKEVEAFLFGVENDEIDCMLYSALAWFALEEAAWEYQSAHEEEE